MRGQSSTVVAITVGLTPVVILKTNINRVRAIVHNDSGTLFITYGNVTPSASLLTHRLVTNDERIIENYTGILTAVKASGNSLVFVTEIW